MILWSTSGSHPIETFPYAALSYECLVVNCCNTNLFGTSCVGKLSYRVFAVGFGALRDLRLEDFVASGFAASPERRFGPREEERRFRLF